MLQTYYLIITFVVLKLYDTFLFTVVFFHHTCLFSFLTSSQSLQIYRETIHIHNLGLNIWHAPNQQNQTKLRLNEFGLHSVKVYKTIDMRIKYSMFDFRFRSILNRKKKTPRFNFSLSFATDAKLLSSLLSPFSFLHSHPLFFLLSCHHCVGFYKRLKH